MRHLAGPWISPDGDLVIQRCALCGFALINARPSCTMVPEGSDNAFHTWKMGDVVEVFGDGSPTKYELITNIVSEVNPEGRCDQILGLCIEEQLNGRADDAP